MKRIKKLLFEKLKNLEGGSNLNMLMRNTEVYNYANPVDINGKLTLAKADQLHSCLVCKFA